ncbi:MAG: hypothetical protein GWN71_26210, partial [Gammaproteobacteria bacterium]|nr:hypothetical protein [Gammaproteobacteria bacterium]
MALLAGSPAIDAGFSTGTIPASDQRGFARVGQADIGALEAGPVLLVDNSSDSGAGSLREALANATTPGSRILFNLPSGNSRIVLSSGHLDVPGGRTILLDASRLVDGSGAPRLEPDPVRPTNLVEVGGVTIDANANSRGFSLSAGGTLSAHTVTVTNGQVPGNGGGIFTAGTLNLIASTISDNAAKRGGGISSLQGALTLVDSTVSGNSAGELG